MSRPHIDRQDVIMLLDLLLVVLLMVAMWQVGAWLTVWAQP